MYLQGHIQIIIQTSLMHLHQLNRDQSSFVRYTSCHEPMRMYKHIYRYSQAFRKLNNRTLTLNDTYMVS